MAKRTRRTRRRPPARAPKVRRQYVCLEEFVLGHKRCYPDHVIVLWDAQAAQLNEDGEKVRLVG